RAPPARAHDRVAARGPRRRGDARSTARRLRHRDRRRRRPVRGQGVAHRLHGEHGTAAQRRAPVARPRRGAGRVSAPGWAPASPWEGEDGAERTWSFAELRAQADGLAALLERRGIGAGDAVGIFLPMLPETVATLLGLAKLGAVFLPLFSGYGSAAVATRLEDAGAKAVVTADGTYRRGAIVPMVHVARQAVSRVSSVHTMVIVPRLGERVEPLPGPEVLWPRPSGRPVGT